MFTSITVVNRPSPDAVLFGVFGEKGEALALDAATKARAAELGIGEALAAAHGLAETTGDAGSISEAMTAGAKGQPKRVLLVGLGSKATFAAGTLRGAAAAAGRKLAAAKVASLSIELDGLCKASKLDMDAAGSAFGEGVGLLGWVCDEFRGKATPASKRTKLELFAGNKDFAAGLGRGLGLALGANFARTLSQTPPNIATPAWMAARQIDESSV